nr:MAG TPA: hypothetical protein [Caudoviricetes sp.]
MLYTVSFFASGSSVISKSTNLLPRPTLPPDPGRRT